MANKIPLQWFDVAEDETIPRCAECASKFAARGSIAFTDRQTNLWRMHHGFEGKGSAAVRAAYCNTCGAKNDPRRKADPRNR